MGRPRVILADDHKVVLTGLRHILEPMANVVCQVTDGRALLEAAERLRPDAIVADLSMPVLNGIEVARRLAANGSKARLLIVSMHEDVTMATEAIRAGARGYVAKSSGEEEVVFGLGEVLAGRVYLPSFLSRGNPLDYEVSHLRGKTASLRLSDREREVLQLVAEGKSLKEIGRRLSIAVRTVAFHKLNISLKLGVKSTAALTRYAVEHGIVV